MEKIKICTPVKEWIDIEDFNTDNIEIQNNVQCIHCDTRDFHIIASDTSHDKGLKDRVKYPNSIIKDTEIFKFLRNLYDKLGGKSKWQMIANLKDTSISKFWRFKYIRFYRITNDEFIVADTYENPIDYKNLLENAIVEAKH